MAAKPPARASVCHAKAPLSSRYRWKLHHTLGHCFLLCAEGLASKEVAVQLGVHEHTAGN